LKKAGGRGASDESGSLHNDRCEWHAVQIVSQGFALYRLRMLWPAQQDPRFPVWFLPWQKHATATLHIMTLERCSPKTTSKHIPTVCCFHQLQAGLRFHTQRQTVGTLTPLSHASPSTLHPPRLVLHRYTLLDGDKQASVQPELGVKQGCPLSPLLFSIYLNDVDSLAEGVQGTLTGIPNFTVPELLFADDLSLLYNVNDQLQTMLSRLRVTAHRKSLTVNAQKSKF